MVLGCVGGFSMAWNPGFSQGPGLPESVPALADRGDRRAGRKAKATEMLRGFREYELSGLRALLVQLAHGFFELEGEEDGGGGDGDGVRHWLRQEDSHGLVGEEVGQEVDAGDQ